MWTTSCRIKKLKIYLWKNTRLQLRPHRLAGKRMFLTMLDLNQMYICRSEMKDIKFGISEKDKELARDFYGK